MTKTHKLKAAKEALHYLQRAIANMENFPEAAEGKENEIDFDLWRAYKELHAIEKAE